MIRLTASLLALALAASCGSTDGEAPFSGSGGGGGDAPFTGGDGGGDDGGGDGGTARDGLPPGTDTPAPGSAITRTEPLSDGEGGYAEEISYDAESDTFSVDNLAFDGDNTYSRGSAVADLGPFRVYEAVTPARDALDDSEVTQFVYRAIYGVSASGNTEFAIVRTGNYTGYGFGGFLYQRNTGVTLPTTGQADYAGSYAGLRDFSGSRGLEYVRGTAEIDIDFADFNDGGGVVGRIGNRTLLNLSGRDITDEYVAAYNAEHPDDPAISALPTIQFRVGPGAADANGEIIGEAFSTVDGAELESGNYYAVISGEDAEEIVGMVVVESADPRFESTQVRETGGFIVYR